MPQAELAQHWGLVQGQSVSDGMRDCHHASGMTKHACLSKQCLLDMFANMICLMFTLGVTESFSRSW